MSFNLKEIDHGWGSLKKALTKKLARRVKVGVFESAGEENVMKATVHEFGAPSANIPERSVIREVLRRNEEKYAGVLKGLAVQEIAQAANGEIPDITSGLEKLGRLAVQDMKIRIKSNISPALKPATVASKTRKNYKQPDLALVATGDLLNSYTYEVTK